MNDPALNNLLQWGIKHADPAALKEAASAPPKPMSASDREALLSIMQQVQGTSDADRMLESMVVIEHPESTQEAKLTAFENFEMMIQNIDNANNMEQIPSKRDANNKEQKKLWTRLVELLEAQDAELRMWAAFCCSTAVQNNIRAQERVRTNSYLHGLNRC
jgi:hsp70-interacting protein